MVLFMIAVETVVPAVVAVARVAVALAVEARVVAGNSQIQ
jgi:hypothetical protein